jgi:hypothetical protein
MDNLDKHIRCECGKFYGIRLFRQSKICKRCKTNVIARGEKNEQVSL